MESNDNNMEATVHLKVTGMMCQKSCGSTVENALQAMPGVTHAEASFSKSYATVTAQLSFYHNSVQELEEEAVDTVECVGFDAQVLSMDFVQDYLEQQQQEDDSLDTSSLDSINSQSELLPAVELGSNAASFQVGGMSCAVCAGRVEQALLSVDGVSQATVTLALNRAQISVKESIHNQEEVVNQCVEAVTKGGYECVVLSAADNEGVSLQENAARMQQGREHELQSWRRLFIISLVLTIPIMVLQKHHKEWVLWILATPVQFGVGARYYKAAWKGWINGRFLGMDFLVVMGTSASYFYSVVVLLVKQGNPTLMLEPTFATGAMLLTFVTLGKFLESVAKGKTACALQSLMELQPNYASRVIRNDDDDSEQVDLSNLETQEIHASELCIGDYVVVFPGARIPADGILVQASGNDAYVDESALSGEPLPVTKVAGDTLYGSTVNQLTPLLVKITATGNHTVLSKIVKLMEDAQTKKAPIQAQADAIACIFAPTVLGIALLTFIGWMVFYESSSMQERIFWACMSSISVVVVACPCALGLATPTAVMVGTGVGATHGLLIKGGAVLEGAFSVDTLIFDKTGTLTTGRAVLGDSVCFDVPFQPKGIVSKNVALYLAACAEKQSEHPLGKCIVNAAKSLWGTSFQEGVQVSEFSVSPGCGVECLVHKEEWGEWRVRVGSREWAHDDWIGVNVSSSLGDKEVEDMRRRGQVAVYVSLCASNQEDSKRQIIGVLGIVDPIEPEAPSTVAALRRMGVDVWMCTGDAEQTANAVARQIGIDEDNVCAGVKPEGKADLVTRLQKRERTSQRRGQGRVAVVGDGINDAVALARADVGVAIGAGTEVAVEAADMVLVRSSLHDVVVALHLSRVVFQRIRWNFVWAIGYNLFAIPFAAGALYPFMDWRLPPEFAGLMMAFSSVSVVTSSLLLRTYKKPVILRDGSFEKSTGWLGLLGLSQRSGPRSPQGGAATYTYDNVHAEENELVAGNLELV